MGDVFHYLNLRAQGRIKEHKFRKSWKAVLYMLEDAAAIPSQNQPCEFSGEPRATFLMDFSPSKLRVASTHGDHTVRVSDVRTGKCTHILAGHPRTPWSLAFSPTSDDILASGCLAGEIRIWDLMGGGSEVLRNPCHGQVVTSLAFHPGGQVLAFATMNFIYFWDWSKDKPFASTQTSHESERIRWLKFDPYGHYLYTGIGNTTSFHRDFIGAELEVSSDGSNEERRHQQYMNRARYQRLLERFMAFQRARYEGYDLDLHLRTDVNDTRNNSNRGRQRSRAIPPDEFAVHGQSVQSGNTFNQSTLPSQELDIETFSWSDSRRGRRDLDSGLPFRGRQADMSPRQRWGRYEPSFFSRFSDNHDNSSASSANRSNNCNIYRGNDNSFNSAISDNAAPRLGINSNQRRQTPCPYPRTILFPPGVDDSTGAPSSSHHTLRPASGSQSLSAREGLDDDEFKILPVDQGGQNRYSDTRSRGMPSEFLGSESSGHRAHFMQQQEELRTLLNRYVKRSSEEASASSASSLDGIVPTLPSQYFLSSAASTGEYGETNGSSSSALLSVEAAQTSSLQQNLEALLYTADSNSTFISDAQSQVDSNGSLETQLQNAVAASTSTSEHDTYSHAHTPATISENSNLLSVNNESSSTVSGRPDSVRTSIGFPGSGRNTSTLENCNPQGVFSTCFSNAGQDSSLLRHSYTAVVEDTSNHSPLLALAEAASGTTLVTEDSNSSLTRQHRTSLNRTDQPEQGNPLPGRYDTFCSATGHVDNNCSVNEEQTQRSADRLAFMNSSPEAAFKACKSAEKNPPHKYTSGPSNIDDFKQSSARNTTRTSQNTPKSRTSSYNNNSQQSIVRPRCTNPLLNNFEDIAVEVHNPESNIPHSRLETIPRTVIQEQTSQLVRSIEDTASRTRLFGGVSTGTERVQGTENTSMSNYNSNYRRADRPEHRYQFLRQEMAPRTHSSTTSSGVHFPFSQTLRNPRITFRNSWGPYEGLEYGHHLSAFHDRQIPRPVTDQTSQTLGAMNLPASSDQGTDVVGLNDAAANRLQASNIIESALDSLTPGIDFNCAIDSECTSNIIPDILERNGVDGSAAQMSTPLLGPDRFQRIQNIVRSVRAYLTEEYGESFLQESVNNRTSQSRNIDVGSGIEGNMSPGFGEIHVTDMPFESAGSHANRPGTERVIEDERDQPAEEVIGSRTNNPWDIDINLPFTASSSSFVDTNSSTSSAHSVLGTSAFHGSSTQVHNNHSIYASDPIVTIPFTASAIQLIHSRDSDSDSDQFEMITSTSRNSSSLLSGSGYRPILRGTSHEISPRFHPYASALHRSRNQFRYRQHTSGDLMSNSSFLSDTVPRESDEMSAGSSETNFEESELLPSNISSRLTHSSETDRPSAFSIFNTSNSQSVRRPSVRMSTSHLNPATSGSSLISSPYRPTLGAQSQSSSQSSSQTSIHSLGHVPIQNCEIGNLQSTRPLGNLQQASTGSMAWRTPNLSLVNQVAVTEYLERRVIELDRRLSDLEHNYHSRIRELQLECHMRRGGDNRNYPTRPRGANIGPLHDPRDAVSFPRAENPPRANSNDGAQPVPFRQLLECLRRQDPNPAPRVSEADLPTSVTISQARDDSNNEETQESGSSAWRRRPWHSLRQVHLHPDYSRNIIDETINRDRGARNVGGQQIDLGVAANLLVQTHRIQQWNITNIAVPNISDASANIVVRHCRLHNDASCHLSQDGTLLATLVPMQRVFSDSNIVALFSLKQQSFAQCLYTKSFGSDALSVSISPLNRFVLVGLASRRTIFVTSAQLVGQVFRLVKEKGGESSMKHHNDLFHIYDEDRGNHVSVNSARWLPGIGEGLVYGTNRGDLHFVRSGLPIHSDQERSTIVQLQRAQRRSQRSLSHHGEGPQQGTALRHRRQQSVSDEVPVHRQ